MRTHTFKTSKSFPESLREQTISWDVPENVKEALDATIGPDGKPYFADEATLVRYAVAQLNIKKGHGAATFADKLATDEKDPRIPSVEEVQNIARGIIAEPVRERSAAGEGKTSTKELREKAKRHEKVESAVLGDIDKFSKAQLAGFVAVGLIDQAAMDASLERSPRK